MVKKLNFWIFANFLAFCFSVAMLLRTLHNHNQFHNCLIINRLPQRGAGVLRLNEPKRVSATLKNFFRKIHKVACEDWVVPSEIGS